MYRYCKLDDPVVVCPYNKSHLIVKSRLQKHIVKCEKNYPEDYKVMCPYDATHRLSQEELKEHIMTCPTRNVQEFEMCSETKNHGYVNFPMPSEVTSTVDDTENWDSDPDTCNVVLEDDSVSNNEFNLRRYVNEKEDLRPPRGFSVADEDSANEDTESIISTLGIGRGKLIQRKIQMKLLERGRGISLTRD
ncbi:uncharacterized protein LOC117229808 [Megalopta genalis]|uniref:uncharacterized protein LOC117229808 n=1 Tax=Megalopta genalis TaxID=115081 RepID=UPI003FD5DBB0